MLEKMGWEAGKGLGARNHGQTEHVKASRKKDTLGLGAVKGHDYAWLATQDIFNQVLADLNASKTPSDDSESIQSTQPTESKEQSRDAAVQSAIRSRKANMFYGKFKKGKDLNTYSKDDLACI